MFKPRLRIPRRLCLPRPASSTSSLWNPVVAATSTKHQQQRSIHASPARMRHTVAALTTDNEFEKYGIKGLLSPEAFHIGYTAYQSWVLNKLNIMTDGTIWEGKDPQDIAIATAREANQAVLFNYASMAHNNHFFFDGLSKTGWKDDKDEKDENERMSEELKVALEASFGSIETLKSELLITADAMFGPGFVWLVRQKDAITGGQSWPFRILTTYLAGSPYPGAHWRNQGVDMNVHGGGMDDMNGEKIREYYDRQNVSNKRTPLHGSQAVDGRVDWNKRPPGGTNLVPVLCVNTWEHVWLRDYGVGGKWDFVANWWDQINWGKVHERAAMDRREMKLS